VKLKRSHSKLCHYLTKARIKKGYTQMDVAKRLGYSTPQHISNWERNLCSPSLGALAKLKKIYGLNSEEVILVVMTDQEEILRKTFSKK